jgi:lysophospholipase L1-like esterase
MRKKPGLWVLAICTWSLLGACSPGTHGTPDDPSSGGAPISSPAPSTPGGTDPGAVVPTPPSDPQTSPPSGPQSPEDPPSTPAEPPSSPPPAPEFQPAFHQALRWSKSVGGLTTFRMRIPVGRAGERLRVTFRSGDGSLSLQKATIALAGPNGALSSQPVQLTFNGSSGFSVGARKLVTSDEISFPVGFRNEVAISFEVTGALSMSAINAFPGSFMRSGAYSGLTGALGGSSWQQAIGVASVDVEAAPRRAFVAIGDSITEGYMDTYNDTRNAWPALVEQQLGLPVVNAAVSGQGFWGALMNLDQEVLPISGATDCLVLLGTNDLTALSVTDLEKRMTTLINQLKPFCHPWVSTLLPKEKTNYGSYDQVKQDRATFNAWIRQQTLADVIDLEAVTRQPANVDLFIDGLEVDGIHPSAQGHRVMAAEVVRVLRQKYGL